MGRDEVEENVLVGLRGIVRIFRTTLNGRAFLNLGGFEARNTRQIEETILSSHLQPWKQPLGVSAIDRFPVVF